MGLGFFWIVGQIIGGILEAEFITQADRQVVEDLTYYRVMGFQGTLGIPIMGVEFFKALPELIAFENDWLTSGFAVMRFVMMCVTFGILFGLGQIYGPPLISAGGNVISRIFR